MQFIKYLHQCPAHNFVSQYINLQQQKLVMIHTHTDTLTHTQTPTHLKTINGPQWLLVVTLF